jgi:hypothetical protein
MGPVYEMHYPLGDPPQMTCDEIPPAVLDDFNEALRCRWVNACNATVEMCRRALESSCEGLGADASQPIIAQIEWVASQGKITSFLRDMANTIRLAGNRGAHPPRAITPEEADAVIAFMNEYLYHVYESRAKLARYDFSRAGSKQKP